MQKHKDATNNFWKKTFDFISNTKTADKQYPNQKEVDMAGIFTRPRSEEAQTEPTKLSAATLGSDVEFNGSLNFKDRLCINGKFEGDITSEGGLLVAGRNAEIRAGIKVGNIISEGKIFGNIIVNDKIELRAPAQVFGDVQAARFSVEEGVVFVGNANINPGEIESPNNEPAPQIKQRATTPKDDDILENQIKF